MDPNGVLAFVVSLLLGGLAFLIVARILPGFELRGGFGSAVLVAFVYGVIKALLWKLLVILSFPLVLLTLGLFIFVINAFMLLLTSWIAQGMGLGFRVDKFLAALLGALIVSIVSFILSRALTRNLKTQA